MSIYLIIFYGEIDDERSFGTILSKMFGPIFGDPIKGPSRTCFSFQALEKNARQIGKLRVQNQ